MGWSLWSFPGGVVSMMEMSCGVFNILEGTFGAMNFLFCSDPLNVRQPDDVYQAEVAAAKRLDILKSPAWSTNCASGA